MCRPPASPRYEPFAFSIRAGHKQDGPLRAASSRPFTVALRGRRRCTRSPTRRAPGRRGAPRLSARYQAILEAVPDIILEVDASRRITWINTAGARFFGPDAIGKETSYYFDASQDPGTPADLLFQGDDEVFHVENWLRRMDGERRLVAWWCRAIKNDQGCVIGMLSTGRDITLQHRQETELRRMAEEELAHLHDQLVRQTQLATIGRLSASVGHELRNPLGVIRNAAYLLRRKIASEDPSLLDYVRMIEEETRRADWIIAELTAMSRGTSPHREPTSLAEIIDRAIARIDIPSEFQWAVRLDPDPFVVDVDPAQWEQTFRNLFLNAIQAAGSHGQITIEARRAGAFDEIRVSDTGPGIPLEHREQVFEPLFTTKGKGTGMGLAICREIIQRHGGSIEIVAAPLGATFLDPPSPGDRGRETSPLKRSTERTSHGNFAFQLAPRQAPFPRPARQGPLGRAPARAPTSSAPRS